MAPSDFKPRREIAALYGHIVPYSTLKKMGMRGRTDGPPTVKRGRCIVYHVPSFEMWLRGELPPQPPNPESLVAAPKRRRGSSTKAERVRRRLEMEATAAAKGR